MGGPQLIYNNYVFHVNKKYNNGIKIAWICSRYRKDNCKARIITTNDKLLPGNCQHNHPPPNIKTL